MPVPSTEKAPKAAEAPKKAPSTTSKAPHSKGKNRIREIVPNSTSPKCKKAFWPRGLK
jgi:hypothetical protein